MEWISELEAIERRAARINVRMHRLCREAGVPSNNLTRWRQGGSPKMSTFRRDMDKLWATLKRMEADLLRSLSDEVGRDDRGGGTCALRPGAAA